MDDRKISYYVYEDVVVRMERTIKRLWVLCIIIFLAFVASNAAWIYYESQWEVFETEQNVDQSVETGDGDTMVTGIGDIYGTNKADNNN